MDKTQETPDDHVILNSQNYKHIEITRTFLGIYLEVFAVHLPIKVINVNRNHGKFYHVLKTFIALQDSKRGQ